MPHQQHQTSFCRETTWWCQEGLAANPRLQPYSFQRGKCKQQFENYQASAILILNNSPVIHVQFAGPVTGAHEGVIEG